jgi:hypothetical protein
MTRSYKSNDKVDYSDEVCIVFVGDLTPRYTCKAQSILKAGDEALLKVCVAKIRSSIGLRLIF